MPELQCHPPALGMHGLYHLFPARFLGVGVNAGRQGVALALTRHLGGLGHDETSRGTLGVIVHVQC